LCSSAVALLLSGKLNNKINFHRERMESEREYGRAWKRESTRESEI